MYKKKWKVYPTINWNSGFLASLNTTASSRSKSSSSVPSKTEEDRTINKAKSNKIQSNDTSTKDRRRKGQRGKIKISVLHINYYMNGLK